MMVKINSCPFCGEQDVVGIVHCGTAQREHYKYGTCYTCGARTEKCWEHEAEKKGFINNEEHVKALWNTRKEIPFNVTKVNKIVMVNDQKIGQITFHLKNERFNPTKVTEILNDLFHDIRDSSYFYYEKRNIWRNAGQRMFDGGY